MTKKSLVTVLVAVAIPFPVLVVILAYKIYKAFRGTHREMKAFEKEVAGRLAATI